MFFLKYERSKIKVCKFFAKLQFVNNMRISKYNIVHLKRDFFLTFSELDKK